MRLVGQKRNLTALAAGFIASAVVYSKALGPYLTFTGEGPVGEFLKLFLLPLAATCIFLIVQSLRAPRAGTAYESAADAAIDGIVFTSPPVASRIDIGFAAASSASVGTCSTGGLGLAGSDEQPAARSAAISRNLRISKTSFVERIVRLSDRRPP